MIQHILFPTDGSAASRKAFGYLLSLAKQNQSRVSLLHTHDFAMGHIMSRYGTETAALQDLEHHLSETGERILAEFKQDLEQNGLEVVGSYNEKGDPGEWILKIAEREHCDLILMGTRGMGALKSVLLGSTSHFVVNHSKVPVFLIPVE